MHAISAVAELLVVIHTDHYILDVQTFLHVAQPKGE